MNAPDVLQNIRSKHPVAYLVLASDYFSQI